MLAAFRRRLLVGHVDDLLIGASETGLRSIQAIGEELGFGSFELDCFVWCGKRFTKQRDGTVTVDMKAYVENLQPTVVSRHRRADESEPLTSYELRIFRGLCGRAAAVGGAAEDRPEL